MKHNQIYLVVVLIYSILDMNRDIRDYFILHIFFLLFFGAISNKQVEMNVCFDKQKNSMKTSLHFPVNFIFL